MKRFVFLIVFVLGAALLPSIATANSEMWEEQTWCFEPDDLFNSFDPCMVVYTDGYSFFGVDQKSAAYAFVFTLLQGQYVSRQTIRLTLWQYFHQFDFSTFLNEFRFLEINLHLIDENTYEGTAEGTGAIYEGLTFYKEDYEYEVTLTIDEEAAAEVDQTLLEEARD